MFAYRCRKSGWPLCGPACEAKVAHNPEVVIPHQTEGTFEIDDYGKPCYLYECVAPLRALFMQKSAPHKFKKVRLNSRLSIRAMKFTHFVRLAKNVKTISYTYTYL